jgi:hypothetical protein
VDGARALADLQGQVARQPEGGPGYNLPALAGRLVPRRRPHAAVVERQTRQLEGLVPARVWGFKSPSPHGSPPCLERGKCRKSRIFTLEVYCGRMAYNKPGDRENSPGAKKALMVLGVVVLVIATGVGSYLFARRDSSTSKSEADQRGAELAQVQSQLRSAAKQNDYLAEQVRQGTQALNNAGSDSQHAEKRLRAALRKARKAIARAEVKQLKTEAKLRGLSSGLKGSLGAVNYTPPAKKGDAGSIQGSITIANSSGTALDAVCVVDVGAVKYAVESLGVPSKGSVVESFQFPYSGPKPSGASSGGCGRL